MMKKIKNFIIIIIILILFSLPLLSLIPMSSYGCCLCGTKNGYPSTNFTYHYEIEIDDKDMENANYLHVKAIWYSNHTIKVMILDNINYQHYLNNKSIDVLGEQSAENGDFEIYVLRDKFRNGPFHVIAIADLEKDPRTGPINFDMRGSKSFGTSGPFWHFLSENGINVVPVHEFQRNLLPLGIGLLILIYSVVGIIILKRIFRKKKSEKHTYSTSIDEEE